MFSFDAYNYACITLLLPLLQPYFLINGGVVGKEEEDLNIKEILSNLF